MKIRCFAFNTYLLAAAFLLGCQTSQQKSDSAEARRQKKELSTLEVHLESGAENTNRAVEVSILRASPVRLHVEADAFLDERDVVRASVTDYMGGFVIQIQFDQHGTLVLDGISTSNNGRRLAIRSDFGSSRWLAAPVLSRRITNGILTFTPDATRDEAVRIVRGLNNAVEKIRKNNRFLGW